MKTIEGKFNFAHVMCDELEKNTEDQIKTFLDCPVFKGCQIRIMADAHCGKGSVIGFTSTLNDYVIPNVVGVDLFCGVEFYKLGKLDIDFSKFDNFIRGNVPSGFRIHEKPLPWIGLDEFSEFKDNVENICKKIDMPFEKATNSIGSLGGGNHALELDIDPEENIWLLIHSGSRNFGLRIANYHQNKARELMKNFFISEQYKDLEFLPLDMGGEEYLRDMIIAQQYASLNRETMAKIIFERFFKMDINNVQSIKSVHNYISLKDNMIRKGAISAHEGEQLVIPISMKDGVIVATGKGNKKWNESSPHGAGRLMGRKEAKRNLLLEDYKKSMEGIWTSCVNEGTIDEAPMVYKDINFILNSIKETVDVNFIAKPIYNWKAQE
jgi:RNA-splicing ligase RtcB